MFRALRLDKMIYTALEQTLRHLLLEEWDRVPALSMIRQREPEIRARSARLLERLPGLAAELIAGRSVIGGGSTPEQSLPTCLIALGSPDAAAAEARLRAGEPPVIVRIEDGRLLLDLRTVFAEEEEELAAALQALS
jgi:L-seryl-tRNA(Ser) seleniumtransferase